jgi:hypothetical protein
VDQEKSGNPRTFLPSACRDFVPGQGIMIPLLNLLQIRDSVVCMLVILSVLLRHLVKAFADKEWLFYLGKF